MADGAITPWTTREESTLRAAYRAGGASAARAALPGRTDQAVRMRAHTLGLTAPVNSPDAQRKREAVDADIRRAYEGGLAWGALRDIVEKHGVNRSYIYRRAAALGFQPVQLRAAAWTDAEIDLLHDTAHMGVNRAAAAFKAKGYQRTAGAIQRMRGQQSLCMRVAGESAGIRTTPQLAELLGVTDQTIRDWIRRCGLRAEDRGTAYRVSDRDLRRWIAGRPLRINLSRIPAAAVPWFITMLSGLEPRAGES